MPKAKLLILSKVKTTRSCHVAKVNPNTTIVLRKKENHKNAHAAEVVQPIYTGETKNEQYHTRI
jgi:hypothetical protein